MSTNNWNELLSCWFWNKKQKNTYEQRTSEQYISQESLRSIYKDLNKGEVKNKSQVHTGQYSPFDQKHVYVRKKKIKSYPVSPDRTSQGDKGYFSDQKENVIKEKNKNVPMGKRSFVVMVANSAQYKYNYYKPSDSELPHQLADKHVPQRSSLLYREKYKEYFSEVNKNSKYAAEKQIEDYDFASTSEVTQHSETDKCERNSNVSTDRNKGLPKYQNDIQKKTVYRFRPSSTGSAKPPGSLLKLMAFRADTMNIRPPKSNKYIHQFPLRPSRHSMILTTADGRLLQPIETDKLRASFRSQRDSQVRRLSTAEALNESSFGMDQGIEPVVYAAPVTYNRRSSLCHSIIQPPPRDRNRCSISVKGADQNYPQDGNKPEVYVVAPAITRGRTGSVLQQSVKSLVSKTEKPSVNRKNIRYSMDTDIFSAEPRRSSIKPSSPRYINMDKGKPMLVSDVLNPITSIFVNDLKDPIPKDPLTKPKECNNWVKPKSKVHQQPTSQSAKTTPKVTYCKENNAKSPSTPRKSIGKSHSSRSSSSSSSEDETYNTHKYKSNQYVKHKQNVYAVEMPQSTLYNLSEENNKNKQLETQDHLEIRPQLVHTGDSCGLNCNTSKIIESSIQQTPTQNSNNIVSPNQQKEEEDDIDVLCYPSEKFLKASVLAVESGSKLRWRIIIKRGDDN